nr:hypothetical protein [Tanacetum cinerariifolium]
GCALLRKKLEEDLVSYLKYFHDTSESSNDSTNVVNAPREPFVVRHDHDVKSSQNLPPIDECCCECGEALDGIFCQQCICKSCGKGAIQFLAFQNLTLLTNLLKFSTHLHNILFILVNFTGEMLKMVTTVYLKLNLIIRSRVTVKTLISRRIFTIFNNSISVVISVGARTKLLNVNKLTFMSLVVKIAEAHTKIFSVNRSKKEKRIEEEQAAKARYWKIPAYCDDDDDDDSAITPILSTKEPVDSLSMGDEHLDTIPATESDEVIKSNVEDLIPTPSEFKGILDTMCDVHLDNNYTPLEAKDHLEIVLNSNDDISSSDDDSLHEENIEYIEASPHNSELVSLEAAEIVKCLSFNC